MRFLVDAQLPPALARRLAALGHHSEHVVDCGLAQSADDAIRAYAVSVSAVIVTKDEDFAVHQILRGGPVIVWVRTGNTRRAELLGRVEGELGMILQSLERGEGLIEIA